jgi:four helix bundle protein
VKSHKDLDVWKRSIDLVDIIYKETKSFPREEAFGLTNQMRRCAISVPSNIAEGAARKHRKEFEQHLYISLGSLSELETQVIIAGRQEYLAEPEKAIEEIGIIRRQLIGLIHSLKGKAQ